MGVQRKREGEKVEPDHLKGVYMSPQPTAQTRHFSPPFAEITLGLLIQPCQPRTVKVYKL
jgi:hypothetical protein